ncbi:uncharacterized protein LOC144763238 isoform X1 [Lissotriton helveticus]
MLLSLESSSPLKRAASGLATSLLLCLSWPPLLFRGARRASQSLNFGESYARRQRDGTPEQRWCGVDPAKTRNSGNVICLISTRILEAKNCGELGLTQDFLTDATEQEEWFPTEGGSAWNFPSEQEQGPFNPGLQYYVAPPPESEAEPKAGRQSKTADCVFPEVDGVLEWRRRVEQSSVGEEEERYERSPADLVKPGGHRFGASPCHVPTGGAWLDKVRGKVAGWVGQTGQSNNRDPV